MSTQAPYKVFALDDVNDYIDLDLTHSVHTSERRSFRGCRRRHDWLFRQYYYPVTTAKPLEFGVAYHKAMEVFYEPRFWGAPRETVLQMAIQTFKAKCKEQFDNYEKYQGAADDEVRKDYKERVELGEGMLHYHVEKVFPEIREKYRPLKVEVSFEVPIPALERDGKGNVRQSRRFIQWCKCKVCWQRFKNHLTDKSYTAFKNANDAIVQRPNSERPSSTDDLWGYGDILWGGWKGLPVTYGGRIDCVMESVEDGRVWIFDWKTCAQLSEDRQEFLELDDQISSYVWAMRVIGVDVVGFVYFEQKKALLDEPEPMKVKRLGRMFSVSKQNSFDAATYARVVEENDNDAWAAGLYDEYIEWLKEFGTHCHAAYTIYRNTTQLEQTGLAIAMEAHDIISPDTLIYPNAGRFNCMNCAFKQPCLSANDGGDYQYALETQFEKRKYHYWVDKQPSTESKGGE